MVLVMGGNGGMFVCLCVHVHVYNMLVCGGGCCVCTVKEQGAKVQGACEGLASLTFVMMMERVPVAAGL